MKANQIMCLLFLAIVLISCSSNDMNMQNYATFGISELSQPDSVLTGEELRTKRKLLAVIFTNLKVKDNKVTFMNRNEFLKEGLAEFYYDKISESVNELNRTLSRDTTSRRQLLEDLPRIMARQKKKLDESSPAVIP
jgi:hypothetical protein